MHLTLSIAVSAGVGSDGIYDDYGYVKFTLEQTTKAQRRNRGIALLLISALDGGGGFIATPRPLYPRVRSGTH